MSSSRPAAKKKPKAPELGLKAMPQQGRAQETVQRILGVASELLGEVGIERLSTNLICERAGLSPPALYRYFPNKYAVLHALGQALMDAQNELLQTWATPDTMGLSTPKLQQAVMDLFLQTLELTKAAPAGIWITRALRAVPALEAVRIESHRHVTGLIEEAFMAANPQSVRSEVRIFARLAIELSYAAQELLFDDPEIDPMAVGRHLAGMIAFEAARLKKS